MVGGIKTRVVVSVRGSADRSPNGSSHLPPQYAGSRSAEIVVLSLLFAEMCIKPPGGKQLYVVLFWRALTSP